MTLVEQYEKHRNEMRPCEPYSESENPEQWARVLAWQEEYSDWLETKLQNKSSNSEYMAALGVIEEYKQATTENVRSCLGVECFVKQRLNQRS